jgi:hypothetical protein
MGWMDLLYISMVLQGKRNYRERTTYSLGPDPEPGALAAAFRRLTLAAFKIGSAYLYIGVVQIVLSLYKENVFYWQRISPRTQLT